MAEPVAKIRHLTKRMGNREIVKDLNFDIHKGEILGFLGPNGAGKTTTMRMMVGLMSISEGDIKINGKSVRRHKEAALKKVGGMIENPEMYQFLSGFDNLVHFQSMMGPVNKQRIKEVTKLVGLEGAIKNKVKTYSLGMRQRLGIAQALLHSPDLLILDEPTNGLDPSGIREIRDYLRRLAREEDIAVFVSSHLLSEVELLCDRIIIIQNGVITDVENVRQDNSEDETITMALRVVPQDKAIGILNDLNIAARAEDGRLFVNIAYKQIPKLNQKLVEHQLDIYAIEPLKQSLEERFLAKTGGGQL
ncbi:ABC-2 type transport system ATP-binding protein [Scopulibacillus daqui]|uniref:ABC-2 type transport system ATP-binding protein n=1 Tax=Scopulibacillus daqui TaxID=1469162 RepID=A0ABS2Q3P5_9BACL|nr:ABC transporter ATP-binding protein [Scopulibacillus daqui]MBM7646826.1 ABC-2 type transport system ATP-binding protein [Scopulibacillus daqui]